MSRNEELLSYIYQNAEMGLSTIPVLIQKSNDVKLIHALNDQLNEYENIVKEVKKIADSFGYQTKELGTLPKISSYIMSSMSAITDSSTTHLAQMMIEGNTKGIIEITRKLEEYYDADEKILSLGKRLLATEESNSKQMKLYL